MNKNLLLFFISALVALIVSMSACNGREKADESLFNEGAQLFEQGRYDDAIEKYLEGLKKDPDNHVGYNLLGMAYRFKFNQLGAQKYRDKEIESFKKAIELEPDYWVAYKNIAASLYYQGKKKDAVPYLEKALELQPNDPEKDLILQWIQEGQDR
jgi:tetratricopeptide (TPR) repeat protein